jgi:hypothetical protein
VKRPAILLIPLNLPSGVLLLSEQSTVADVVRSGSAKIVCDDMMSCNNTMTRRGEGRRKEEE